MKSKKIFVITAGFVELDEKTAQKAHRSMAQDLENVASVIGLVPTRYNKELLEALSQTKVPVITGFTQEEILQKFTQLHKPVDIIWLEGGFREMYQ